MEHLSNVSPAGKLHSVVFDFDGTLSLIRKGWQEIMTPYFTEVLMETPGAGTLSDESACAREFIDLLTGKQTIFQCIRLNEEVVKRGGTSVDPLVYKNEYHRRLLEKIEYRRKGLAEGTIEPVDYLVPGSVGIIESLLNHGIDIYLASGTDEVYVKEEVALLKLDGYFGDRVYGARDDYRLFSKAMVIKKIIEDNNLHGSSLAGFGDGYVEIENIKEVGGVAIGVATDEERMTGIDEWKRQRLIKAGADVIIADFTGLMELEAYLFGG
ncbi:MAG TPA: HAD hydrolase-like protein [Clostridia bacterium]|nr:HAD hydrolase-like protein [Clostridia bacterium]HRX42603.1 HAD hydrolase-like protein [Clostridia bacterium]